MTQKNRTLEGKNRTLGGEGGSKIVENRRKSSDIIYVRSQFGNNFFTNEDFDPFKHLKLTV